MRAPMLLARSSDPGHLAPHPPVFPTVRVVYLFVQVVFSDHTEILLSKEARLVTFLDKDGNRETQSLQRVVREQR